MYDELLRVMSENQSQLIAIAIILVIGASVYLLLAQVLRASVSKGTLGAPVLAIVLRMSRWVLLPLVTLLVLQQFGILQNVWAAILGVMAAIAIGFVAGWSIISHIFSTLLILMYKPFRIGDVIRIPSEDLKGEAVDLNMMFTTLKSEEGYIQVPNNTFFTKTTVRLVGTPTTTLYEQLSAEKPFESNDK